MSYCMNIRILSKNPRHNSIYFNLVGKFSAMTLTNNMKEIEKILIDQVKNKNTPSVQYILFNRDSIIREFNYGRADILMKKIVGDQIMGPQECVYHGSRGPYIIIFIIRTPGVAVDTIVKSGCIPDMVIRDWEA